MGKNKRKSDLICLWSGEQTTGVKSIDHEEHIFPECIGGKKTLPVGDVSWRWNNELSWLDNILKKGHPAIMQAYQDDPNIKGKKTSDKERRRRRAEEKTTIESKIGPDKIKKANGDVSLINVQYGIYNETFSRALHKCVANVLCFEKGSIYARKHYSDLINFVKNGSGTDQWPYAVSYANPFQKILTAPTPIKLGFYSKPTDNNETALVCFMHSSGIWIGSSQPNSLFKQNVEYFGDAILTAPIFDIIKKEGGDIENLFGMRWESFREYLGKLNFLLVKKQIEGSPDSKGHFYLLTRCGICNQINPTGIMLPRNSYLKDSEIPFSGTHIKSGESLTPTLITIGSGDNSIKILRNPNNSWNMYSVDDLKRKGIQVEKLKPEELELFLNQGIEIPPDRDVRKLNITNSKVQCANCGNTIIYNASDCFL